MGPSGLLEPLTGGIAPVNEATNFKSLAGILEFASVVILIGLKLIHIRKIDNTRFLNDSRKRNVE